MGGASWRQAAWRLPVYALLIFAVLMLATEAAIYSDYRTERASRIALLEHDLRASVHINHQTMLASLHDVGADVCYLAEHAALYRLINGDPAALDDVARNFSGFAQAKLAYDQVRYLDASGHERVRINVDDQGRAVVVPLERLQDKSHRYYVQEASKLKRGELYMSPLDLNMENGRIEQPPKPMIRFAAPLFDEQGAYRGMLVLNYRAGPLLRRLLGRNAMLLNVDGGYLHGGEPAKRFAFMYGRNESFSRDYPDAWAQFQTQEAGVVAVHGERFGFDTLHPHEIAPITPGSAPGSAPGSVPGSAPGSGSNSTRAASQPVWRIAPNADRWKLVTHEPHPELTAGVIELRQQMIRRLLAAGAMWLVVSLILAALLVRSHVRAQLKRKAERELFKSEARFTALAANVPGVIYQWYERADGGRGYHYVSPRSLDIFGVEASELVRDWRRLPLHPDDVERWEQSVRDAVEHASDWSFEGRFILPDGSFRWWRGASRPVVVSEDEIVFHGVVTDIHDSKLAQENLTHSMQQLEEAQRQLQQHAQDLAAQSQQLDQARVAAEQANRAKSAFLANMSHEIRTPMTAILGYADLLTDPQLTADERMSYIETIRRNGRALLMLINDILDLSRIEEGRMQTTLARCSPWRIAAEVAALMRVRAEEKALDLVLTHDGPIPEMIWTDAPRLRQVLVNLVGNAIKFTERGRVTITLSMAPGSSPGCQDAQGPNAEKTSGRGISGGSGGGMRFAVADTGIGMAPDQFERLFKPFSQVDTSTTRRHGGTGLGLAISRRLAQMLGGDITVASELNAGSTFTAAIDPGPLAGVAMLDDPAAASPAPDVAAPDALPERLAGRVLLVEDAPANQRLIQFILARAGLVVELAGDGREAVQRALAVRGTADAFDLILMDIQMPVMDGFAATRELRERGYAGPIIALTAHAMAGDRDKCLEVGCDDYLSKPVNRGQMLRLAARYLPQPAAAERE